MKNSDLSLKNNPKMKDKTQDLDLLLNGTVLKDFLKIKKTKKKTETNCTHSRLGFALKDGTELNLLDVANKMATDVWSKEAMTRTEKPNPKILGLNLFNHKIELDVKKSDAQFSEYQFNNVKEIYGIDIDASMTQQLFNDLIGTEIRFMLKQILKNSATFPSMKLSKKNAILNFFKKILNKFGGKFKILKASIDISKLNGTTSAKIRKIISYILAGSNFVAVTGRRGPADKCILNVQLASILQDSIECENSQLQNSGKIQSQNNFGFLYHIGTFAGLQIWVDPNMQWDDTSVIIARTSENCLYHNNKLDIIGKKDYKALTYKSGVWIEPGLSTSITFSGLTEASIV
jgi:hypothetical protein